MSDHERASPSRIVGTENGAEDGPEIGIVYNRRLQILAAKDRIMIIVYADFGTKDQRIIRTDYTAQSIGTGVGFTARKTITYTLVGTRYRRDTIEWSIV